MDELKKSEFSHLPEMERRSALEANCEEAIQSYHYSRPLTEKEIEERHELISQNLEKIETLKEQAKDLNAQKSELSKDLIYANKELITGKISVTETVYKVSNLDTGMYEIINGEGFVIDEKRIKGVHSISMFRKVVNE